MPIEPRVHVSLRLAGDFHPDAVTTRLGITPSDSHAKGAPVGNGRSGRRYRQSRWFLGSEGHVRAETFEPHVRWLLDQVEPRSVDLVTLMAEGVDGDVDCYWESTGMSGGPVISPTTMARLSALNLPLTISFYLTDDLSRS